MRPMTWHNPSQTMVQQSDHMRAGRQHYIKRGMPATIPELKEQTHRTDAKIYAHSLFFHKPWDGKHNQSSHGLSCRSAPHIYCMVWQTDLLLGAGGLPNTTIVSCLDATPGDALGTT